MNPFNRTGSRLKPIVLSAAVVATAIVLFQGAQSTNVPLHSRISGTVRQMKELDAQINQDALAIRFGLLTSCDGLAEKLVLLGKLQETLDADMRTLYPRPASDLSSGIRTCNTILEQKSAALELFKSSNAVLANSRAYFPHACSSFSASSAAESKNGGPASPLLLLVSSLEHNVLRFNLTGDTDVRADAENDIRAIIAKRILLSPDERRDLRSVILHARVLLKTKPKVDALLGSVVSLPSTVAYNDLENARSAHHTAESSVSNLYRIALFMLSLITIGYGLWAYSKLRVQARSLSTANDHLEQRVEERTKELKSSAVHLANSEKRFRTIFSNAAVGIARLDLGGSLLEANSAMCRILGAPFDSGSGNDDRVTSHGLHLSLAEYIESGEREAFVETIDRIVSGENSGYDSDQKFCLPCGKEVWGRITISLVRDEQSLPSFMIVLIQDTTEQKRAEERIQHLAYHDTLTGLPNRAHFLSKLDEALHKPARNGSKRLIALLFIDCDNFKRINDTLGHEAGDEFLKQRANCLKACVRENDTVARLGGDEFTILLENLTRVEQVIELTERVLRKLREPMVLQGQEIFGSASIGIALNEADNSSAESMMREADTAMYQIKTDGKADYTLFDQQMNDRVNEQLQIETGLRRALDEGQFRVHYQPLVDLETGATIGTEALVRWEHPEYGLIPPGKFIPIAEETGLIVPIGYWVMEEACRQTKVWQQKHPSYANLTVNVNLSGRQLQRQDVVERVKAALELSDFDPNLLKLEITESVMMKDVADTRRKLNELKVMGVKLAMDDFCTGYSSMASLMELPVDTIKIDRTFISRLGEQVEAEGAVAAIIALAKAYGLDSTGEGIETEEQIIQLQSYGCRIGQGYFFGKPAPADKFEGHLISGMSSNGFSREAVEQERIERLLGHLPASASIDGNTTDSERKAA